MPTTRDNIPSKSRREAIANADAHLNNAWLPTYSELAEALLPFANLLQDEWPDDKVFTLEVETGDVMRAKQLLLKLDS